MTVALLLGCAHTGSAQQAKPKASNYPPQIGGSTVEVYKTVGDVKLNMYIFTPEGHQATDKRPAIVFFFGGGWRGGSPTQFAGQCQYLASRGMVAMTADYRVLSRHGTPAAKCVADAKSAIRWVRTNAARLGVDPDRIVASGGSAGGHIAACTGVIKGFDEESEDTSTSSVPNAMVLFNPATVLAPVEGEPPIDADRMASLKERMGVEPIELSPYHHVSAGAPPTLILHGKADTTVPYHTVELFTEAMTKAGNRCELEGYADQAHGFFNARGAHNAMYTATLRRADVFLKSLGYLEGEPTLAAE
ncbi:MAG: alpha/beta hydrolase fold domain-containing protein [Phycisphaera sp.]|nr:alpha/beta hydrolase fold domain-containing protein [Phycisphaera sp.]